MEALMRGAGFRYSLAVAGAVLLAVPAAAQDDETEIAPDSFAEDLHDTVPHAGTRALGVIADGGAGDRFASVYVRMRAPVRGRVCVAVSSVDGRYVASALYNLDRKAGVAILRFPTQKLGPAAQYSSTELVVAVRAGTQCGDARQPFMVGTWQPPSAVRRIGFAVNAGAGANAFIIEPGRGRVDCEPASRLRPTGDNAAITHVCWVSQAKLTSSSSLRVFRETPAGRTEIDFPLQGGGASR